MYFRFLLFAVASMFHVSRSCAQEADQDKWLRTISGNAIKTAQGSYQKAPAGYALYFTQAGNIRAPYLVYIPKGYNAAKPTPMVVFLHGAILARDSFQYKDPAIAEEPIFSIADVFNTIVVFPFARSDFRWSGKSPAYEHVVSVIGLVEQHYNVDKGKVYIGGISMGGIATFWFINHTPDIFAGFYTFSAIPQLNEPIKFGNITKQRPLYSMNTKDDHTFSFGEVKALYEEHKTKGWHFIPVETGGHRFIYGANGRQYVKELLGNLLSAR